MVKLEVGKFYIDNKFDSVFIFDVLKDTRLKSGEFIDLYLGKILDMDSYDLYDESGNLYYKEYANAPFQLRQQNVILMEDNRSVIIASNYISYSTEFIKKDTKPQAQLDEYEIQNIVEDLKEVEFTASIAKVKVGDIVLKKNVDTFDKTDFVVEKTDNNTKLTFNDVVGLQAGDTLAFMEKPIEKKIYFNLHLLSTFEIDEDSFTIKLGNDEILLGSMEKLSQVKKYLGVLIAEFQ